MIEWIYANDRVVICKWADVVMRERLRLADRDNERTTQTTIVYMKCIRHIM